MKLVTLEKKQIGTGFKLALRCTTCGKTFPLSICHHLTCYDCKKAYCPDRPHVCEEKDASSTAD
jgi:hypothetical protein